MPETKFVFDRLEKETEQTIADILEVVQKKPYPDQNTTILAGFIHALFQRGSNVKQFRQEEPKKEMPAARTTIIQRGLPPPPAYSAPKPISPILPIPVQPQPSIESGLLAKENTLLPIMPEAPSAVFKRREYAIDSFDSKLGVVVDNDDTGKPVYKLTEPQINDEALKLVKEYIEKDFEKDFTILDKKEYMNNKIQKACRKKDIQFTDDYAKAAIYLLKRDLLGFRRIDALMYDSTITGIYCEGVNKPILVELKDYGKIPTNIIFTDVIDLNALLYKIARATDSKLTESNPIMDTMFQGYKIQAVLGIGGMSSKLIIKK